mgnify:CR=1 FL=1
MLHEDGLGRRIGVLVKLWDIIKIWPRGLLIEVSLGVWLVTDPAACDFCQLPGVAFVPVLRVVCFCRGVVVE